MVVFERLAALCSHNISGITPNRLDQEAARAESNPHKVAPIGCALTLSPGSHIMEIRRFPSSSVDGQVDHPSLRLEAIESL
jgi:hypothetical protein